MDFDEYKKKKQSLYQTEQRFKPGRNPKGKEDAGFSIIDYNEYRNLQEKIDRIRLKADLYENRRDSDYINVQKLSSDIHSEIQDKESLKKQILKL